MKYIRQFLIIITISFIGEIIKHFLPVPIPASIYGLVLLFFCLQFGIIRVEAVKDVAGFLIEIMPLLIVPAGVGMMKSWGLLQPFLVPVLVIIAVSTVLVMVASGWVTQLIIHLQKKKPTAPL